MAKLLLLSSVGPRLPLVASIVAHAAIVAAAATGHGSRGGPAPVVAEEQPVDFDIPVPVEPLPPLANPEAHDHAEHAHGTHTHTHPYALPADHDAHPHDPSIDHRHAPPAAAAPVLTAEEPGLPHFAMVLGAADVAAGGIARTDGEAGPGRGIAPPAAPNAAQEDEVRAVSVPARLASSETPEYPAEARAAGAEADVTLEIVVDPAGRVVESKVLRPAGRGFDESALKAIRGYRFTPAQHDGAAVRVRMAWTVAFRLE